MKYLASLALALTLVAFPAASFAAVDITLFGANPVTMFYGQSYSEPGYSANSTVDGDITGSVSIAGVNGSVGTHTITYSVTDSALDTALAFRTLRVFSSEGTPIWCSGPTAPGWQNGLVGGGCGGTEVFLKPGEGDCPAWFPMGCISKR